MRQFGGYKILKEQQRAYFRKHLERDLDIFWKLFGKSGINKIDLLKQFALKKYNYTPQISYLRKQFNSNIKMKKWIYARCYVCGESPTIAHHVIQIQNGGQNIKKNIIRLCKNCHERIHPWLYEKRIEKEKIEAVEQAGLDMDKEFREITCV